MKNEIVDIFQWANNTDAIKHDLNVEIFFFNKNYTPYRTELSASINDRVIKSLFLYDLINFVNLGAGTGLMVRDVLDPIDDQNVLRHVELEKVGRAETLLHIIETQYSDIVTFSHAEHDFKRIKGIVARFTYNDPEYSKGAFYVVKSIPQAATLNGANAWAYNNEKIFADLAEVSFKVPTGNEVLITKGSIFAFNPKKFETVFNYSGRKLAVVEQKSAEIEKHFKLSFPDGLDLSALLNESKKAINKVQTVDVERFTQEQVIEIADEMELELMTDDNGAIIIMDGKDLDTFLTIINDDYVTGVGSNTRYIAKSKKPVNEEPTHE